MSNQVDTSAFIIEAFTISIDLAMFNVLVYLNAFERTSEEFVETQSNISVAEWC